MGDAIKGGLAGMLLGTCVDGILWFVPEVKFLYCAVIGGVLGTVAGVLWGDDFFTILSDLFWRR